MGSSSARSKGWLKSTCAYVRDHLNFFRIHVLFFTFTPLIFSGILCADNRHAPRPVAYIDSLFNCVSAMTMTGLATIDLSGLSPFQQALLFIQMCLGNIVLVSWVMVYIRRNYFAQKFKHIVEARIEKDLAERTHQPVKVKGLPWWRRLGRLFRGRPSPFIHDDSNSLNDSIYERRDTGPPRLRLDMIRRMQDAPRRVDPSGWISEGRSDTGSPRRPQTGDGNTELGLTSPLHYLAFSDFDNSEVASTTPPMNNEPTSNTNAQEEQKASFSAPQEEDAPHADAAKERQLVPSIADMPVSVVGSSGVDNSESHPLNRSGTISSADAVYSSVPRTQTVEFAPGPRPVRSAQEIAPGVDSIMRNSNGGAAYHDRRSLHRPTLSIPQSTQTNGSSTRRSNPNALYRDFGGFPMPHAILSKLLHRLLPRLEHRLKRTLTMPRTQTIVSHNASTITGARPVSYISFEAVVGRNSTFMGLTHEQLEELGGVEFRALTALLWIVGGYHVILQLVAFVIVAPYMSIPRWAVDFRPPMLHQYVSPVWFSAFQVVSAYSNTGFSLEDTSMVPFQEAYPTILVMIFLILAGNTAFPIFLRLTIWTLSKMLKRHSRVTETLHFLLDHPRRCFIYLFPSHQTWFLVTILIILNGSDWFFFLILDLGNSAVTVIPAGVRVIIGLLQATAVRTAGFSVISLSVIAPALKTLYVIMMYVSAYPIAISVRSTNVYEEKSLGVFNDEDDEDDNFNPVGNRVTVWSRYLSMHVRKQLSFDMWWLATALFLVCIIERDGLDNAENATWFNIFSILFELVAAYGTVGLSLSVPYANYSFSGALRPLSKLVICVVMLRGRHRGLPVAIDRAVMLPSEFQEAFAQQPEDQPPVGSTRSFARNPTRQNGDISSGLHQRHAGRTVEEVPEGPVS